MDKIDFSDFLKTIGQELQTRIDRAAFYKHPSGVGDAREDIIREYLQQVLPPRFSVDRGKIFDSEGNLSREFDIIISEANDIAPAMSLAGRRIVPVEAVYGVIEIKSQLNKDNYTKFIQAVDELNEMCRYYCSLYPILDAELKQKLDSGLSLQDDLVGWIWSGIIAFEAPNGETLSKYLEICCNGLWFICIPSRELISMSLNPKGFRGRPYGLISLPLMIWLIMDLVTNNKRSQSFVPNFSRYRSTIITQIGDLAEGWQAIEKDTKAPST